MRYNETYAGIFTIRLLLNILQRCTTYFARAIKEHGKTNCEGGKYNGNNMRRSDADCHERHLSTVKWLRYKALAKVSR